MVKKTYPTNVYLRDANGNVMAIYETINPSNTSPIDNIAVKEISIYGSSRLGLYRPFKDELGQVDLNKKTALGQRIYEFSNHLGNVLVTLNDFKVPNQDGTYKSIVLSASDYYPFGMAMTQRTYQNSEYRYGFNGQEKSDELDANGNSYTAEFWQYSSVIGRRWNIDPVVVEWESGYAVFRNSPISLNDPNGDCSGPDCPERVLSHTIKSGDTFFNIAKNSGGKFTVEDLHKWNPNVDNKELKVGQKINIEDPNSTVLYTERQEEYTYKLNEDYSHTITYNRRLITKVVNKYTGKLLRSYEDKSKAVTDEVVIGNNNGTPVVLKESTTENRTLEFWKQAFINQMETDPTYNPYSATRENCPKCTAQGLSTDVQILDNGVVAYGLPIASAALYVNGKLKAPKPMGRGTRLVQAGVVGWILGRIAGNEIGDYMRKNNDHKGRQDIIELKIKVFGYTDSSSEGNEP